MKKILLPFALLFFLFFLLLFPSQAFSYAKAGLMLWFYTLLPSLLPFMILSNICIKTGLLDKLFEAPKKFWKKAFALSPSGAYALCMGLSHGRKNHRRPLRRTPYFQTGSLLSADLCLFSRPLFPVFLFMCGTF